VVVVVSDGGRPSTVVSDGERPSTVASDGGCGLCKNFGEILEFRQWETT